MLCCNCGTELSENARFCSQCGTPVSNMTDMIPAEKVETTDAAVLPSTEGGDSAAAQAESSDVAAETQAEGNDNAAAQTGSSDVVTKAQTEGDDNAAVQTESSDVAATSQEEGGDNAETLAETSDVAAKSQTEGGDNAAVQTETSDVTAEAQKEGSNNSETQTQPSDAGAPAPRSESASDGQDLILRKEKITLSDGILKIKGNYYRKKGRRYKKTKGDAEIPLSAISNASFLRRHYWRKRVASFLLVVIFACGTLVGGGLGFRIYRSLNAPYRQVEAQQIKSALDQMGNEDAAKLQELELDLNEVNEKIELVSALQTEYFNGQRQELMSHAAGNLDLDLLFSEPFFQDAFEQYLTDLLNAFKNDLKLDAWLYPYYTYTLQVGENQYINSERNLDMWFYETPGGEEKFTADIENGAAFLSNVNEFDLYDLIYYCGRIYITASDLMNEVLQMPNYVADSAVFVRAYGGNPDPSKMSVPGWNASNYEEFWSRAEEFFTYDYPIWTSYRMSAADFDLNWNDLVNEQAYYDAYVKFMNTIAPGLSVYDMVSYSAGDDAYGGMSFDMTGKEAAPTEIALLYLQDHPEAMEKMGMNTSTTYDDKIAETQEQLEQLTVRAKELTDEIDALTAYLKNGDALQAEYDALLRDIEEHRTALIGNLCLFIGITAFLLFMTAVSLGIFIRYGKKPGKLMILELKDGTVAAFNARRCPKQKLEEFMSRCNT